jgi:nucleotide-binding universal stress UspA family protein
MWQALDTAFGGLPPDLEAESLVTRGDPGPILVGAASRDGDRLVVGAGRRGTFGRFHHGKVSRYCLAHAGCPVIAVPSPALDRAAARAARASAMRAFRT